MRLAGFVLAVEALFGLRQKRLTIRREAGRSAAPYVGRTLLAARRVTGVTRLVRGLDRLLFET